MIEKGQKARAKRIERHKKKYAHIDWENVRKNCEQEVLLQRHVLFGTKITLAR